MTYGTLIIKYFIYNLRYIKSYFFNILKKIIIRGYYKENFELHKFYIQKSAHLLDA